MDVEIVKSTSVEDLLAILARRFNDSVSDKANINIKDAKFYMYAYYMTKVTTMTDEEIASIKRNYSNQGTLEVPCDSECNLTVDDIAEVVNLELFNVAETVPSNIKQMSNEIELSYITYKQNDDDFTIAEKTNDGPRTRQVIKIKSEKMEAKKYMANIRMAIRKLGYSYNPELIKMIKLRKTDATIDVKIVFINKKYDYDDVYTTSIKYALEYESSELPFIIPDELFNMANSMTEAYYVFYVNGIRVSDEKTYNYKTDKVTYCRKVEAEDLNISKHELAKCIVGSTTL